MKTALQPQCMGWAPFGARDCEPYGGEMIVHPCSNTGQGPVSGTHFMGGVHIIDDVVGLKITTHELQLS
jgi:hypothetical protein